MNKSVDSATENDTLLSNGSSRQTRHGATLCSRQDERYTCGNEGESRIDSCHSSGREQFATSGSRHGSRSDRHDPRSSSRRKHHDSEKPRSRRSAQRIHRSAEEEDRCSGNSAVDETAQMFQFLEKCQGMLQRIQSAEAGRTGTRRRRAGSTVNSNMKAVALDGLSASQASYITQVQPTWQTKNLIDKALSSDGDTMLHKLEVSLLCPLTQSRIVTPVRGEHCRHLQCFDGRAFLNLMTGKHCSKWLCPCCRSKTSHLILDAFTQELLKCAPQHAKIVEFTSSMQWKVKQDISDIVQESQTKGTVVDLTGIPDTPVKVASMKSGYMKLDTSVIDLTMSP